MENKEKQITEETAVQEEKQIAEETAVQEEKPRYKVRPAWQVWGARVGLVLMIITIVLSYIKIATGGIG